MTTRHRAPSPFDTEPTGVIRLRANCELIDLAKYQHIIDAAIAERDGQRKRQNRSY